MRKGAKLKLLNIDLYRQNVELSRTVEKDFSFRIIVSI